MVATGDIEAHLDMASIPALRGVTDLLQQGFRSSLHPQLLPYTLECTGRESVSEYDIALLVDPQTSGGLLCAMAPDEADALLSQVPEARAIGHIASHTSGKRIVVG
jgi:selenide,water dikinase